MDGQPLAGVVNLAFGWAALVPDFGVQSFPFQSIRWSGASLPMPSHHTSLSLVKATLVNRVFCLTQSLAFKLDAFDVPGATPKNPASGLMA